MRRARGYGLGLALIFGLSLGTLPLMANDTAAQPRDCGIVVGVDGTTLCTNSDSKTGDGGDATANGGNGGRGGNGGFASVHDIANAIASATSSVIVGDITTRDAFGHSIFVDARGGDDPSSIAGSFSDTGVDIVAPAGNVQAGTTGGYGIGADASGGDGGDGGDATATGGKSGDADSCAAGLLGCFRDLVIPGLGLGL